MENDFDFWSKEKQEIDKNKSRVFFKEREIWFAPLGINIGYEQNGVGKKYLRPVLVIKKFSKDVLLCAPLSRSIKNNIYNYVFRFKNEESAVILSQIRLIDSKRLFYKIGFIGALDFCFIKEKVRQLIA